jgi:hypothetical protein
MGMYTGLRFKATLRPFVADTLAKFYNDRDCPDFWGAVSGVIPISNNWMNTHRRDFIPFGAISYLPDDWDEESRSAGLRGTEWHVCCSLKNYEGEIELFLREVLPHLISDMCRVEYRYEEWEESRFDLIMPEDLISEEQ